TGDELFSFFAYDPGFTGGVFVAAGDVNGDGVPDVITGAGAGGGPHVKVFSGLNLVPLASFMAYGANFTGRVSVAAGDVDADFMAFPPGAVGSSLFLGDALWLQGLRVGVADVNGDRVPDLVVGPGTGRAATVRVYNGTNLDLITSFTAFDPGSLGGVFVGAA